MCFVQFVQSYHDVITLAFTFTLIFINGMATFLNRAAIGQLKHQSILQRELFFRNMYYDFQKTKMELGRVLLSQHSASLEVQLSRIDDEMEKITQELNKLGIRN